MSRGLHDITGPLHFKLRPRDPLDVDIIISVDRCLMSNHHSREFLGFMATGPAIGIPDRIWRWIACPKMKTDSRGRPWQAPYGLRKIEAVLQEAGYNAYIIDPDYVAYYIKRGAKALMIGHHDYFAFGPPSNEWWMITGKEPINRRSFIEFISMKEIWEAKRERRFRVVVGGPAAWQWLAWPEALKLWPVDTIVEGEAERIVVKLADKILNDEGLPRIIRVPPSEAPSIEEIPVIKGASVNGLVEIMRGCPRGCKFCSVTLRPLRFLPLDHIMREIELNLESGVGNIVLHSEDVLLYGAQGIRPRSEPLIKLHSMISKYLFKYNAGFSWSHASLASIRYAEEHGRIISKIVDLILDGDVRRFLGVEVGLETGSTRLVRELMPAKVAPYKPEDYPDVVEEAFAIMSSNNIFPAATFILGLPGEREDDVYATIELLDRLESYPSLIVPMFFVPLGALRDKEAFKRNHIKEYHIEALRKAALHSIRWAKWILNKGYLRGPTGAPLRILLNILISYIEHKI
ncbi:MAG: B12-binding domain-containing radical SAM protein, partial [Desulfurococcales archaeon]|nr:B12-binding domain-containing radical SAM protein [Desulfurococcales archaeon]